MGEETEGGVVGTEVGTIVWVRRRNGSWWPGRILGQHELSASHLMSPRSGTPVKLLGREDASVDWYNLEKSKRVKAFRCGEFDACIEKAEASQGIPIKKREKYARREDAIVHALELEREMLERRLLNSGGSVTNKHSGAHKKDPTINFPSEGHIMPDDTSACGKLAKCRKVGLPVDLAVKGKSYSDRGIGNAFLTNEALSFDVAPHMRGVQDFGLQAFPSKMKSTSGSVEKSKRLVLTDNVEDIGSGALRNMDDWNAVGNPKACSSLKGRSLCWFTEESKRKDRRRPLHQVLLSSSKYHDSSSLCNGYLPDHMKVWPSHFGYNDYLEEENALSGLIGPYEPELHEQLHLDPSMEYAENLASGTCHSIIHEFINSGEGDRHGHEHQLNVKDRSRKRNLRLLSDHASDGTADARVSKWNLKGKRNIRKLSKRATDRKNYRNIYNDNWGGCIQEGLYNHSHYLDNSDLIEKDLESVLTPTDEVMYPPMFQGSFIDDIDNGMDDSDGDSSGTSLGWNNEKLHHTPRRRHWDELPPHFGHGYTGQFHERIESRLVDVNLKVQASYQGEHVPLVSLMSRLNGKAIIGHPIQIEALNDGFTDTLLANNDFGDNPYLSYASATPPVWRTGRRTNLSRTPRSLTSTIEGQPGILHHADPDSRRIHKTPLTVGYDEQIRSVKTNHGHRSAKKSQKKSKKVSLSNLKTRTLSSLAKGQKNGNAQKKGGKSSKTSSLSILMKPGDTMPMVTCVPVKVVFSRILEAVGKSSSTSTTHQHLTSNSGSDDPKLS